VILSGFGGQGILFAGQLLCYAGMAAGWEVTWIPSYGPEMRGGTANCTVVLSDEPIGSPLIRNPLIGVVMSPEAMVKYEPSIKPGGLLVFNTSLIREPPARDDIDLLAVAASDIATEMGNVKMANVVALGALLGARPIVDLRTVEQVLDKQLTGDKRRFVKPNQAALRKGALCANALKAGAPETSTQRLKSLGAKHPRNPVPVLT
jgi:2-oxoglutarate ferredoxin oxidoreductase subunit gamma